MTKPIKDPEQLERHLEQFDQAPVGLDAPDGEARQCQAPVRPGSHNAAAARRYGCEDEWIDRMNAKYGGEW